MSEISDARRRNMAAIRAIDTAPEMLVRRALHNRGYRYGLHSAKLPGRPDLVLTAHCSVVFVHGCFWHRHGCSAFRWPATREQFWRAKLDANKRRDDTVQRALLDLGWRIAIVWECSLRPASRVPATIDALVQWVEGDSTELELTE